MAFAKATHVKRYIYVTDGFMVRYTQEANDLCEVLRMPGCKWSLRTESELREFVGPGVTQRLRRQREVLAFVTQEDIDNEEPSSVHV